MITAAGAGGTNFALEVYDATKSASLCSATIACTTAGGTAAAVDCGSGYNGGDQLVMRINSSTCTTRPKLNANVRVQE